MVVLHGGLWSLRVVRAKPDVPAPDAVRWRFSTLRLLGFVTATCVALALGVAMPRLCLVCGMVWFFATVALLRLGTVRDTLMLVACAILVIVMIAILSGLLALVLAVL